MGLTVSLPDRMLFQWHITERCNLHCSHCYQEEPSPQDPPWEDLLSILAQFRSFILYSRKQRSGKRFPAHVTVTGGEPFVREDFLTLLELLAAERRLFSFAVLTNGTMITPSIVHELGLLKPAFVQVSIDGAGESHDRIRGSGSYKKAVEGLQLLVRSRIPTHISFTAHRDNYREFPLVAQMGRRLGVDRIWSDRMVPCGRGSLSKHKVLSSAETMEFFELMQKENRHSWLRRSPVALNRSLQFMFSGDTPYRCSAGNTLVTVLPNGDICPCRRLPLVVGNIFKESLHDVYFTRRLFIELRDREKIPAECAGCFYSHTCRGGSRCLACAVHGDPFHADPGCWLVTGRQADKRRQQSCDYEYSPAAGSA